MNMLSPVEKQALEAISQIITYLTSNQRVTRVEYRDVLGLLTQAKKKLEYKQEGCYLGRHSPETTCLNICKELEKRYRHFILGDAFND